MDGQPADTIRTKRQYNKRAHAPAQKPVNINIDDYLEKANRITIESLRPIHWHLLNSADATDLLKEREAAGKVAKNNLATQIFLKESGHQNPDGLVNARNALRNIIAIIRDSELKAVRQVSDEPANHDTLREKMSEFKSPHPYDLLSGPADEVDRFMTECAEVAKMVDPRSR